jgi:hypothetical protein
MAPPWADPPSELARSDCQSNLFPQSLALLFGGDVWCPVKRPCAAQFTREVLLMELLAAEASDEELDDGAMLGSEDEY